VVGTATKKCLGDRSGNKNVKADDRFHVVDESANAPDVDVKVREPTPEPIAGKRRADEKNEYEQFDVQFAVQFDFCTISPLLFCLFFRQISLKNLKIK